MFDNLLLLLLSLRLVRLVLLRHAAHGEGRHQDLKADAAVRVESQALAGGGDEARVQQRPAVGAGQMQGVQVPPRQGEKQRQEHRVHGQLPPEAHHEHLERDHEQDGVEVVEDRQDPALLEEPGLLQARSLQHAEEDAGAGRRREPGHEQGGTPGHGARQHVVQPAGDEDPRESSRGHCHEVVEAVAPELGLVDVELVAHVHHQEREAEHGQDPYALGPQPVGADVHVHGGDLREGQAQHQHAGEDDQPPLVRRLGPRVAGI
mmetsp:Transcript_39260/g.103749  ORF Transcript_39260/g.103749 Transcript_39260/m.103749 type:complete len:262 (-) Transcript_39260:36-821(-)